MTTQPCICQTPGKPLCEDCEITWLHDKEKMLNRKYSWLEETVCRQIVARQLHSFKEQAGIIGKMK